MGTSWRATGLGLVIATIGLAAGAGCASSRAAAVGQGADQVAELPDAIIQMRRGGCPPDRCPVYGVSVFMDGTVVYDGRVNVAVRGERTSKLPADRLKELIAAIDAMDFLDSPENCCVCPDNAAAHLTIVDYRPGSVRKTVVHDGACRSAPPAMNALERFIDQTTGVVRWTVAPPIAQASLTALTDPVAKADSDLSEDAAPTGPPKTP